MERWRKGFDNLTTNGFYQAGEKIDLKIDLSLNFSEAR